MFKVRFHLGAGEHFQHWQVTNKATGEVAYYDPSVTRLQMSDATLRNQPGTARKIHQGANKSVCAWIDCKSVLVVPLGEALMRSCELALDTFVIAGTPLPTVRFNPKVAPHWVDGDGNFSDLCRYDNLFTVGRRIVVSPV